MDEMALHNCRMGGATHRSSTFVTPDYVKVRQELQRKGMTLMLLWQDHSERHPDAAIHSYSQFCETYRRFAKTLKCSMRQTHRAGEKMFIDYAGPTVALIDGVRAHIFVSAMGASGYTFAYATPRETTADWLGATAQALRILWWLYRTHSAREPQSHDRQSKACAATIDPIWEFVSD